MITICNTFELSNICNKAFIFLLMIPHSCAWGKMAYFWLLFNPMKYSFTPMFPFKAHIYKNLHLHIANFVYCTVCMVQQTVPYSSLYKFDNLVIPFTQPRCGLSIIRCAVIQVARGLYKNRSDNKQQYSCIIM